MSIISYVCTYLPLSSPKWYEAVKQIRETLANKSSRTLEIGMFAVIMVSYYLLGEGKSRSTGKKKYIDKKISEDCQ